MPADKGKATVIMDTAEYEEKVKEMLGDEKVYNVLKKDPTAAYKRKLVSISILMWLKENTGSQKYSTKCYAYDGEYSANVLHTQNQQRRYAGSNQSKSNHIYWYMAALRLDYTVTQSRRTQSHKVGCCYISCLLKEINLWFIDYTICRQTATHICKVHFNCRLYGVNWLQHIHGIGGYTGTTKGQDWPWREEFSAARHWNGMSFDRWRWMLCITWCGFAVYEYPS